MAMIQFLRGTQAGLAVKETINGALYFTTDTHKIYMGTETGKQEFSAIEVVSAVGKLPSVATAIKGKFYYAEAENVFCFPYNGEWKQVNPDTGATSIEVVDGGGNAISAASYDASTRKITLTKGETFATPAVVDGKISAKVGTIDGTVKDYVDKKTSGIASESALTELSGRVTTAEGKITALENANKEGGAVANAIADAKKAGTDAQSALNTYKTTNDAAVKANTDAISAINNETTGILAQAKTYADGKDAAISAAKAAADAAQADVDALKGKVGTIADGSTVSGLIATAQAQADKGVADAAAAQADVNALKGKVGTVPENKTVVQMISEAQAAATYNDTEVRGLISDNKKAIEAHKTAIDAKVTTLIGEDSDKSVRTIASEETAKIVAGADASFDTLKEIADWISNHKTDAAAMNSAIVALEGIVDGIGGEGEKATVVAYVTDAIAALKIGDYAKAADLTALAARVGTLEATVGKAADGENAATGLIKDIADNASAIAAEKTRAEGAEAANKALAEAAQAAAKTAQDGVDGIKADYLKTADKTELQGNIDGVSNRVKAIEDKNISNGANKVEASTTNGNIKIDGTETVVYTHPAEHAISEVTGLQSALDAKAAQTSLDTTNASVAANASAITALQTGKADKATTLAGYGITDAYTQAQVDNLLTWVEF